MLFIGRSGLGSLRSASIRAGTTSAAQGPLLDLLPRPRGPARNRLLLVVLQSQDEKAWEQVRAGLFAPVGAAGRRRIPCSAMGHASSHDWFKVHRLDARSHFPMFEVPDVMVQAIEEFLCDSA